MFEIPLNDRNTVKLWIKSQDNIVANSQNKKYPNYGAIGGVYSYSFTPTNIGTFITITNNITKEELKLEDL